MAHVRRRAVVDDALDDGARRLRQRDQDFADLVLGDQRREVVDAAEDRRAADPEPDLVRIVVDEPDDADAQALALLDLLQQLDAGRAGADDDREGLDASHLGALAALAREPDADPDGAHERGAEEQIEQEDRAWKSSQAVREDHHGQEERGGEDVAADDVLDVVDADVPPRAAEEAGDPEADVLARQEERQRDDHEPDPAWLRAEIEPQPEGEHVGGRGDREVGRDAHRVTVANEKGHGSQAPVAPCESRGAAASATSARISRSAPDTVSTALSVMRPWNGSARQVSPAASVIGNWPGRKP